MLIAFPVQKLAYDLLRLNERRMTDLLPIHKVLLINS